MALQVAIQNEIRRSERALRESASDYHVYRTCVSHPKQCCLCLEARRDVLHHDKYNCTCKRCANAAVRRMGRR